MDLGNIGEKLLSFFHELKVPTGYCSNIRRLANMKDLKFNMHLMKAHNCHVIMTQLLPVAIRGVLLEKVRDPVIKLCSFFNTISHKVIDPATLDKLKKDMHHTMSRLEMHLPLTFFICLYISYRISFSKQEHLVHCSCIRFFLWRG
jgi:hypothetical protein